MFREKSKPLNLYFKFFSKKIIKISLKFFGLFRIFVTLFQNFNKKFFPKHIDIFFQSILLELIPELQWIQSSFSKNYCIILSEQKKKTLYFLIGYFEFIFQKFQDSAFNYSVMRSLNLFKDSFPKFV